jgi:hypothetical protein
MISDAAWDRAIDNAFGVERCEHGQPTGWICEDCEYDYGRCRECWGTLTEDPGQAVGWFLVGTEEMPLCADCAEELLFADKDDE